MGFTSRIVSAKELSSIPFDVAYRLYIDAANMAEETMEESNRQSYERYILRKEQEWNDTHEYPYEGNFSDEIPYVKSRGLAKARQQAGNKALIEEFIPRYKLDTIMTAWVLPQIMTWLTRKKVNWNEVLTSPSGSGVSYLDKDSKIAVVEGQKIDGTKMAKHIFDFSKEWDMGLYHFLRLDSRSSYVKSQYKEGKQWCSLVPFILYAYKLNHGIYYKSWNRASISSVVNPGLVSAMLCEVPDDLTREELLAIREEGLIYKTGSKAGEARSPVSTYKLYGINDSKIGELPELAQAMLTQIWCAHPQNRTKYMVLDPTDWDRIPTPLITSDFFGTSKPNIMSKAKDEDEVGDMPWLV